MKEKKEVFSRRLNKILTLHGIKKGHLAEKMHVTPQTISRWCNPNSPVMPDDKTIDVLTRTLNYLCGFSNESEESYRSEFLTGETVIRKKGSSATEFFVSRQKRLHALDSELLPLVLKYVDYYNVDISYMRDAEKLIMKIRHAMLDVIENDIKKNQKKGEQTE